MMYSVANPYRLDQGDVSFDAPDSREDGDDARDRRQPLALRADHRHPAPARADRRQAARRNGIPIDDVEDVLVTNGGIHGLYILCLSLLDPGDEVLIPDPAWPPAAGNILAAQRRPGRLPAARVDAAGSRISTRSRRRSRRRRACSTQLAEQPDRRRADAAYLERLAAIAHAARSLGDLGRSLRRRRLRGRAHQHRVAAGHVRAHDSALHLQQELRDDRPAARLHRDQRRERSATARRRSCSTPRATSRRSCSTAASARSKDRRTASRRSAPSCARGGICSTAGIKDVGRRRVLRPAAGRRLLRVPADRSVVAGRRRRSSGSHASRCRGGWWSI